MCAETVHQQQVQGNLELKSSNTIMTVGLPQLKGSYLCRSLHRWHTWQGRIIVLKEEAASAHHYAYPSSKEKQRVDLISLTCSFLETVSLQTQRPCDTSTILRAPITCCSTVNSSSPSVFLAAEVDCIDFIQSSVHFMNSKFSSWSRKLPRLEAMIDLEKVQKVQSEVASIKRWKGWVNQTLQDLALSMFQSRWWYTVRRNGNAIARSSCCK